jgi:peptidyl-prolyl cis-trans isomerase B (cyclophilin B)
MKQLFLTTLLGLALGVVSGLSQEKAQDKDKPQEKKEEPKSVSTTNEVAVIETSKGEMVVEFWPDVAPKTVENFKKLSREKFYDGTAFHRIIKGFMVQGGDPLTKDKSKEAAWGTGDPGYKIKAEFNNRSHQRGVLSMARSAHPDSAGCQFFICHGDASFLDQKYTAFGIVIRGDDVLEKIATTPTARGGGGENSKPLERVEVKSIKIVAKDSLK